MVAKTQAGLKANGHPGKCLWDSRMLFYDIYRAMALWELYRWPKFAYLFRHTPPRWEAILRPSTTAPC